MYLFFCQHTWCIMYKKFRFIFPLLICSLFCFSANAAIDKFTSNIYDDDISSRIHDFREFFENEADEYAEINWIRSSYEINGFVDHLLVQNPFMNNAMVMVKILTKIATDIIKSPEYNVEDNHYWFNIVETLDPVTRYYMAQATQE